MWQLWLFKKQFCYIILTVSRYTQHKNLFMYYFNFFRKDKRIIENDLLFCMSTKSPFLQNIFLALKRLSVSFPCLPVLWLMCLCILTISGIFCASDSDFDLFAFCKNIKVFLHSFYVLYRKKQTFTDIFEIERVLCDWSSKNFDTLIGYL